MKGFLNLTRRNSRLFFCDKGLFFSALITPMILLVLYATFLANVYHDSFVSALPQGLPIPDDLIDATVGGQLLSSLLAVSAVTVSFCCNMLMVQDKTTGAVRDLRMTPVKPSVMALGYYTATFLSSLLVCLIAAGAGFIYLANTGWYMSASDVMWVLIDLVVLVMFGTALSSVVNFFLTTQGQISAVGTIVSSSYGFICGAYMPISNFPEWLQRVLSFLPGTYGTSVIRNHTLAGVFDEMAEVGFPTDIVDKIRDSIDCNLYFFGERVSLSASFAIIAGAAALFILLYILENKLAKK